MPNRATIWVQVAYEEKEIYSQDWHSDLELKETKLAEKETAIPQHQLKNSSVLPRICWDDLIFSETIFLTSYVMQIETIWISTCLRKNKKRSEWEHWVEYW